MNDQIVSGLLHRKSLKQYLISNKQNIKMFKYLHKKGVVVMVFGTPTINDEIFLKNNLGNDCSLAYVDNILPKENTNK